MIYAAEELSRVENCVCQLLVQENSTSLLLAFAIIPLLQFSSPATIVAIGKHMSFSFTHEDFRIRQAVGKCTNWVYTKAPSELQNLMTTCDFGSAM